MPTRTKAKDLVKLVDDGRLTEVKDKDAFRSYLSNDPPAQWIKPHPLTKGVDYLPIDKVEALLDTLFQDWEVEIKSVNQLAQSICAVVRLHYRHPVSGDWMYHDGVGATPLKTDKGFTAADLAHIKSDAVSTGAPAAVSFAVKDAAERIGNIFGRNLNRKDTVSLSGIYNVSEDGYQVADAVNQLDKATTMAELKSVWSQLSPILRANAQVLSAKNQAKEKFNEGA